MSTVEPEQPPPPGASRFTPRPLGLRKSIDALSSDELARYREAIALALAREEADKRSYLALAGIPDFPGFRAVHRGMAFLPWNRLMLCHFERELMRGSASPPLPWWDWSSTSKRHPLPEAFAEKTIDGRVNPLYLVELPEPISAQGLGGHTYREPGDPALLPSVREIENVLALQEFEDFSSTLESLHNRAHAYVGGTLNSINTGAYDPLYWSLQANVDRLWRLWQVLHPSFAPADKTGEERLMPFGTRVREVLDVEALGYSYDVEGGLATQTPGATGASNDRPSADGGFGFEAYAEAFASLIASPLTTPPLTIGVYASWGMGKSSLLGQIAERLRESARAAPPPRPRGLLRRRAAAPRADSTQFDRTPKRVHVVDFNAWDYSASEQVWPALVRKTMDRLEESAPQSWQARYGHRLRRNLAREWTRRRGQIVAAICVALALGLALGLSLGLRASSVSAVLGALGVTGLLGLIGKAVSSPVSGWLGTMLEDTRYGRATDMTKEIRDDLKMLEERLGKSSRMLIVIDDLDRCEASKAVEVLQAVNLLLSFEGFVVCLGVDARILTASIEAHYRGLLGEAGASGYEYLDKIIQVPFRIPEPTAAQLDEFLAREISVEAAFPAEADEDALDPAFAITGRVSPGNLRDRPSGSGDATPPVGADEPAAHEQTRPLEEYPFIAEELQAFTEVAAYLRPNPRHIKRLINVYRLVRTLAEQESEQAVLTRRTTVIRWLAVSAQWPYSSHVMTRRFAQLQATGRLSDHAEGRLLSWLHEQADAAIDSAVRARLDEDPERLAALLKDTGADLSPADFLVIQRYTINFNPAVAELPVAAIELKRNASKDVGKPSRPALRIRLPELVANLPGLNIAQAAKLLDVRENSLKRAARALSDQRRIELQGDVLRPVEKPLGTQDGSAREVAAAKAKAQPQA